MLEISDEFFALVRKRVYEQTGIVIRDDKRLKVATIVSRRVRELKLADRFEYEQVVRNSDEWLTFVDRITVNETSFFRNPYHFSALERIVIPRFLEDRAQSRRLRIWSAGCSTGEEPYSLAMAFFERMPMTHWRLEVLATDISNEALAAARIGRYKVENLKGLAPERVRRFFKVGDRGAEIKPFIKRLVRFQRLNFRTDPYPDGFDLIFCRNVMIYFDESQRQDMVHRFAGCLEPGGWFFVGHSESLQAYRDLFEFVRTGKGLCYRKPGPS